MKRSCFFSVFCCFWGMNGCNRKLCRPAVPPPTPDPDVLTPMNAFDKHVVFTCNDCIEVTVNIIASAIASNVKILVEMITILLFAAYIGFAVCQDESPIVDTLYGPVRGQRIATHYGIFVNSFYGIPFAADPVDDLRFEVIPAPRFQTYCSVTSQCMPH